MKKVTMTALVLLIGLALLTAAGCAKKPAPASPTAATTAEEQPVVAEMPSQEIGGIREQAITEEAAGQRQGADVAVPELQRIYYEYDQYTLSSDAREILGGNAAYLKANSGVRIAIEGHCDERGSDEYNLALGERRARAAMSYLVSLGISPDRLSSISYGEERPLDTTGTEAAWAKNRRAEFKIVR